ncbi:hypothetical protein VCHENC03_2578B, partial [Vibrio sp. HENC-03]
KMNEPLY